MLKNGELVSQLRPSALLQQMKGKVFEIRVPEELVDKVQDEHLVGNIRIDDEDRIWVRVIGDKKPDWEDVREVLPSLEDVYLYTFEEKTAEEGSL